jgi:parvulin-like peptidyl-prolyl isomerase
MRQENQAMKSTLLRAAVLGASVVTAGCGLSEQPQPLIPSQFVRSRSPIGPNPIGQPVGQSGALAYGELHMPLLPDEYPNKHPAASPGVARLVQHEVPGPGEVPGTQPAAVIAQGAQSQPEIGESTGYQVVGTVLATVNSTPIFADKVLASLDHVLAAEAQQFSHQEFGRQKFQAAAKQDIASKIEEVIYGQVEIAQATSKLGQDAKNEARLRAQIWRHQQIVSAGGSEAVARQRALESGKSLDELTKDQYNNDLVQLFLQQHVFTRVHVSVADMRRYYDEHLQSDYSTHSEARFRLIRIDFAHNGTPEEAAAKANRIIDDLKAGANFEDEAGKFNDDPSLQKTGGDIGWMQKGGYKYDSVEQAVWALKPNQFTDRPIEVSDPVTGNAFYIAQLLEKRGGTVKSFEDVETAITNILQRQQFYLLRRKEQQSILEKSAVVRDPHGLEIAVEMAMQRYPVWASAR